MAPGHRSRPGEGQEEHSQGGDEAVKLGGTVGEQGAKKREDGQDGAEGDVNGGLAAAGAAAGVELLEERQRDHGQADEDVEAGGGGDAEVEIFGQFEGGELDHRGLRGWGYWGLKPGET
jgi:hypothetical protein